MFAISDRQVAPILEFYILFSGSYKLLVRFERKLKFYFFFKSNEEQSSFSRKSINAFKNAHLPRPM